MKIFLTKYFCVEISTKLNIFGTKHEAVAISMSMFKYGFKRNCPLPSPNGPLSREVPVTAISAANKEVMKALKSQNG